jgi:hypothetical protein
MTTIRGRYISKGCGYAGKCLEKQVPKISETFPEFAKAHCGTINVELEQPLVVFKSDHRTDRIDWIGNGGPGEIFDIVRIQFEVKGERYDGWLYVAEKSPFRKCLRIHEVVLREQIDIQDGEQCSILIEREGVVALGGVVGVL